MIFKEKICRTCEKFILYSNKTTNKDFNIGQGYCSKSKKSVNPCKKPCKHYVSVFKVDNLTK